MNHKEIKKEIKIIKKTLILGFNELNKDYKRKLIVRKKELYNFLKIK